MTPLEPKAPTSIDQHVGQRIGRLREARGLTQQQLADRIGVTYQQYQKYEYGSNRISAGRLYEIGRLLGVGLPYFYAGLTHAAGEATTGGFRQGLAEEAAAFVAGPELPFEEQELLEAFRAIGSADVRRAILDAAWAAANASVAPDE